MWLTYKQYLDKINNDSEKYWSFSEHILKIEFDDLPLKNANIFNNENSIFKLEIGFGNGDSLIELAKQNPQINYFGIDRKMDRARTALSKLTRLDRIENLIISRIGTDYLLDTFENETFHEIIMNFPDPWPKKKHNKNRTVNNDFLKIIHSLLKKDGVYRFASDHEEYSLEVLELFKESDLFENMYSDEVKGFKTKVKNRIPTQFEKHKIRDGFTIHHIKFKKLMVNG